MKRILAPLALVLIVSTVASADAFSRGVRTDRADKVTTLRSLSLEFVGQLLNSPPGVTPATHEHYGYLANIRGIPAFRGQPENETTALFTFYASARTVRVISNGPLRVVTRIGKLTIYRDPSANGSFAKPETFRDGTQVLVATLRQQSVVDTVSDTFTTFHQNRITSTQPFRVGSRKLRLGVVGEPFTTEFRGHSNMPGPPSGYLAGFAVSPGG